MIAVAEGYEVVSRWHPEGPSFWLAQPALQRRLATTLRG